MKRAGERVPLDQAVAIVLGVCAGLHHAHERVDRDGKPLNIVHRDVSPSNIMVGYEGVIKLVDFGVAKASERSQESRAGAIKGKISYVSPEQCKGEHIDRRSDIYSLGIVMWEMLTGRRLYKRESDFMTMLAVTNEPVPPPSTLRPGLSPEIERIVMTALEKDREKRFPSAAAMLEEIEAVATLERHLMSGSAMARFMKEHFGTKPEPWVGLPPVERTPEVAEPVTVTSQSLPGLGVAVSQRASSQMLVVDGLQNMLEHAPDLRRADTSPVDGSDSRPSISEGSRQSQPSLSAASLQVPALVAPPPRPAAPARKRSPWVILVALVITLGGAAAGMYLYQQRAARTSAAAEPTTTVAMTPAPVKSDEPVAKPAEPATPAEAPTSAETPTPAAPVAPTTIADAIGKQDWETALQLCAVGATAKDVASCGLAACNFKRKDQALLYHGRATGREQAGIEQACRGQGITLVTRAPVAKPRPRPTKSDPCKDPAYVEANPLKCQ
jgi:hypothetical protein